MSSWFASVLDTAPSMASFLDRTPSLGRSDDSGPDISSIPPTPSDKSPAMYPQHYAIPPPMESVALHPTLRAATPQPGQYAALPDIMDPATAASIPIRHVCCIGAGYVGESPCRVAI